MKLEQSYTGRGELFEGNYSLWLRCLPEGTLVTKASITLVPTIGSESQFTFSFVEPISSKDLLAKDWGVTKTEPANSNYIEIDFHSRRTLAGISGSGGICNLQVDMGGTYLGIAEDGTLLMPEKLPYQVTLSSEANPLPGLTVTKFRLARSKATYHAVDSPVSSLNSIATGLIGVTREAVNNWFGANVNTEQPAEISNPEQINVSKVSIRSVPSNINIRLGTMSPFWQRPGELAKSETSPDISAAMNAYLKKAPAENGFYQIPFVIHSDSLARLDILLSIEYVIEKRVLPPHLSELTLSYGLDGKPGLDEKLTTVTLPRKANPVTGLTQAKIRGEFEPSRIALASFDAAQLFSISVTSSSSLAQAFVTEKELAITGVDIALDPKTQSDVSGLKISFRSDFDGKPSNEVLVIADLQFQKALSGRPVWAQASLDKPFNLSSNQRYWLVLQTETATADWLAGAALDESCPFQSSQENELAWRKVKTDAFAGTLTACYRLRETPDQYRVPLKLQIGKGADAKILRFDEFDPLGRVDFTFDFAEQLTDYLKSQELPSSCATNELLLNGNFELPPHDDASVRLFGFGCRPDLNSQPITGEISLEKGVDLSNERYICFESKGKPTRIDCRGKKTTRTQLDEIVNAANKVVDTRATNNDYKLKINSSTLYPWCRSTLPTSWRGTVGQVAQIRLSIGREDRIFALISGSELVPFCFSNEKYNQKKASIAELVQSVSVNVGIRYRLTFVYGNGLEILAPFLAKKTTENEEATKVLPGLAKAFAAKAACQIIWRDDSNQVLSKDEYGANLLENNQEYANNQSNAASSVVNPWTVFEMDYVAPENAVTAELRFFVNRNGSLLIGDVSLQPTSENVRNGQFHMWRSDPDTKQLTPVGWFIKSGIIEKQEDTVCLKGVSNNGSVPDDSKISQLVEINAGKLYELRIDAVANRSFLDEPDSLSINQCARIELFWIDGTNNKRTNSIILPLDGSDFPVHAWSGIAPEGTVKAEVCLIQPKGRGNLQINSISMIDIDTITVPLTFLSEAPGELTLSELRVTYDK